MVRCYDVTYMSTYRRVVWEGSAGLHVLADKRCGDGIENALYICINSVKDKYCIYQFNTKLLCVYSIVNCEDISSRVLF
jgi:hypothetical protein